MRSRLLVALLAASLAVTLVPTTSANPGVPYCTGSVAGTDQTRVIMPEVCEQVTGRVFPEAFDATDFVSFYEFEAGINYLAANHPDRIAIHQVSESFGLMGPTGLVRFPIYVVEVTNFASPVPLDERQELLFMLSIHGNEKGGREGGFRVIEDLVTGKGIATETVQNGAGMPTALAKPGGGSVETYADYLDFTRAFFLFPNADGWAHDEAEFFTNNPVTGGAFCGTLFCRTNGNGTDLNRQVPTVGWHRINADAGRLPVNEPEAVGYISWMASEERDFDYAIDIHGMLNHENFVAVMLPAGSMTPQEMLRSTRLAEELKERLNNDDYFAAWTTVLGNAATAGDAASGASDPADGAPPCAEFGACTPDESPSRAVGSGEFSDWGTVWDAIGYTDSGFSGDFFAQSTGLNAPGYDIELAYNHITVDSQYEGAGAQFNDYHIHSVRHIVKSFMDAAALDVTVSIETNGLETAYIRTDFVATNIDDPNPGPGGWAGVNPNDDQWEYSAQDPFTATPDKYWQDISAFLRDGDAPGTLRALVASQVKASTLERYDNLVIPGSAIATLDQAHIDTIRAWVEAGGNLVLTDDAIQWLDAAGVTADGVDVMLQYAGAINMDRAHPLTEGVRGFARQTYEPIPLGFSIESNSAPAWYVDAAALADVGGEAAGYGVSGQAGGAMMDRVSLGRLSLGSGNVQFIGALLPDPSEEFYHPYGLDDYATTYSGNQILRNMLGWTEVFAAPPVILTEDGTIVEAPNEPAGPGTGGADDNETQDTPLPFVTVLVGLAVAVALVRRR